MNDYKRSYKQFEKYLSYILLVTLLLFILFLIGSGTGILWLKAVTAILTLLTSLLSLIYLYLCKELLRRRSLWISMSFTAIALCILFSLILRFPSPNPYKLTATENIAVAVK